MWMRIRPDATEVLRDKKAQTSLSRYFSTMQNQTPAKFLVSKRLPAKLGKDDSMKKLWQKHTNTLRKFRELEVEIDRGRARLDDLPTPETSFLDLKIAISKRILRSCRFCARGCGAKRSNGDLGYCRCGERIAISSILEHLGEEPELVPSGTIFSMGCTMRCKHCQNWTISQWVETGKTYESGELANEIENLRNSGCRNANLVGGEPTPWLNQWLETFRHVDVNVPIVWNSNSYYGMETAQLLAGFADVYLLDFKYGPGDCARRISDSPDYWETCVRNHVEASKNGELIVRILILPNHLECCTKPIVDWIAEKLGTDTRVNVMFQYRPEWQANTLPELCRTLTKDEMEKARKLARNAGLRNLVSQK